MYKKFMRNERRNEKLKDLIPSSGLARIANVFDFSWGKFIEDFSMFIKQCYCTVENVEK